MNRPIEQLTTGDVTATMAAAALLLETFPLEAWETALQEELIASPEVDGEPASAMHRRAKRAALLEAAGAARRLIAATRDAMAHNRATARALDLELSLAIEQADRPPAVVRQLRAVPNPSRLHQIFPGARRTIPTHREEAWGGNHEPA